MNPVDELRSLTGAGLLACRRALAVNQQSVAKASRWLRRRGEAPEFRGKRKTAKIDAAVLQRGYRFDVWAEAIAGRIDRALSAQPSGDPARHVEIGLDDQGLWPVTVVATLVSRAEADVDPYRDLNVAEFPIPDSFDEEDQVLERFIDLHLDDPTLVVEVLTLADYFALPGAFWRLALHRIARRVRELADERSATPLSVVVSIHGEELTADEEVRLWQRVGRELAQHFAADGLFVAFRDLVYETPEMRERLDRLRRNPDDAAQAQS